MDTFVFRLIAPRPTFAVDMTDDEREIMGRHAAYWRPLAEEGRMVVFGPVLDGTGSWGLGVVEPRTRRNSAHSRRTTRRLRAGPPASSSERCSRA
jgi:uncharacterized protein